MDWYLNRALTTMRNEVNAAYPRRDKTSDGTIGDTAHQNTNSDHNPDRDGSVDAWDMDVDLGTPNNPAAVEHIKARFQEHPAAEYWIHNDQIAIRGEGWRRRSYAYAGPGRNRHNHHVHFNTRPQHEGSTQPWGITGEDDDMQLSDVIYKDTTGKDRTVKQVLGTLDVIVRRDEQACANAFKQVLAAVAADDTPVTIPPEHLPALAAQLAAAMPTAATIADAVNDDAAARLTS
ncbi:hypothetical protein GCM10010124_26270 [Pilimelia terevasa]|uniref:Uncharacterized protein n=1 Tax=Pilimelia terevasa TaxID=53372 RepID=A0A8J3BM35_9ACTN|nr:hypothetical protein [Pilimelia terevasa]GGK32246.1 hypothetical protein GCM10010124_26270 [Pilimelia terevasa]